MPPRNGPAIMAEDHHAGESAHNTSSGSNALPRNVHLAVPIGSALMLVLVAFTTANPGDITKIFIPVFLFMVVVYVFASMYLFKRIIEGDRSSPEGTEPVHSDH